MRAIVLREYEQPMAMEERPLRDPVGSEVLLRVRAAGVCGTDLKLFRGQESPAEAADCFRARVRR